jgi:hypothetical protein
MKTKPVPKKLKFAKPVKKKKQSVSSLKKKVWTLFSEYIRLRDCLETTGCLTRGRCVTCGRIFPFKSLQAGHFLAGRGGENLFDERGCHAQCVGDNVFKHGDIENYYPYMLKRYGQDVIDELKQEKRTPKRWTVPDLEKEKESIQKSIDYIRSL